MPKRGARKPKLDFSRWVITKVTDQGEVKCKVAKLKVEYFIDREWIFSVLCELISVYGEDLAESRAEWDAQITKEIRINGSRSMNDWSFDNTTGNGMTDEEAEDIESRANEVIKRFYPELDE